jgi:hypothetical protein
MVLQLSTLDGAYILSRNICKPAKSSFPLSLDCRQVTSHETDHRWRLEEEGPGPLFHVTYEQLQNLLKPHHIYTTSL